MLVLQKCEKKGSNSNYLFSLKNGPLKLSLKEEKLVLDANVHENVTFYFDSIKLSDGIYTGNLICRRKKLGDGWIDSNLTWHSGIPRFDCIKLKFSDEDILDCNYCNISFSYLDIVYNINELKIS